MYLLLNQLDDAIEWYTRALDYVEKSEQGGTYHVKKNKAIVNESKEERVVRRALLLTTRGESYERRSNKDHEEAERHYISAIKLYPKCLTAYLR